MLCHVTRDNIFKVNLLSSRYLNTVRSVVECNFFVLFIFFSWASVNYFDDFEKIFKCSKANEFFLNRFLQKFYSQNNSILLSLWFSLNDITHFNFIRFRKTNEFGRIYFPFIHRNGILNQFEWINCFNL